MRLATPLLALLLGGLACADEQPDPADAREAVVLLHGLGRNAASMRKLEARLEDGGYRVRNIDYPSRRATMTELVAHLDRAVSACCAQAPKVHFVTYSLGGILTRAYLAGGHPPNLGRVVMLAPPNQGSEWVDRLGGYRAFQKFFGPVGSQLGTDAESLPNQLGPPDFEFGVIAGTAVVNPLGWLLVPGESDGTVSVERTQLPGMRDFMTVSSSHTFIMNSPEVAAATRHFLAHGRFPPAAESEPEPSG